MFVDPRTITKRRFFTSDNHVASVYVAVHKIVKSTMNRLDFVLDPDFRFSIYVIVWSKSWKIENAANSTNHYNIVAGEVMLKSTT